MLRSLKSLGFIRRNDALQSIARCSTFKSDLCLKTLYPNSRLELQTPPLPPPREDGKFNGFIPINQLKITYSRSSGPGGQNIDKTETKADVRFHVMSAEWISKSVREQFVQKHKNKINKAGFFVVKSQLTRYQAMNLADALERIRNYVREIEREIETDLESKEESPEKVAEIQRRHEKAARERLFRKRDRSLNKKRSIELKMHE